MSTETAFQALKFGANKVILAEGDYGDQAYLIREGVVEIRKGAYGESPRVLALLGQDTAPHTVRVQLRPSPHRRNLSWRKR